VNNKEVDINNSKTKKLLSRINSNIISKKESKNNNNIKNSNEIKINNKDKNLEYGYNEKVKTNYTQ
jgi:hypothetical protein